MRRPAGIEALPRRLGTERSSAAKIDVSDRCCGIVVHM